MWATHEPRTNHPKRTQLVTKGLHPELVGHSGYTHAVSNWWGLYPDLPVNGFRQGAPPPFFPSWPCSAALYSGRATGVGPFPFTSLNFRFCHNCRHHRRQSCVQFDCYISDIFSGMPVPPTAFPWPFKFTSGGVRTYAKPPGHAQRGNLFCSDQGLAWWE